VEPCCVGSLETSAAASMITLVMSSMLRAASGVLPCATLLGALQRWDGGNTMWQRCRVLHSVLTLLLPVKSQSPGSHYFNACWMQLC
jgi:hypothetical protein